MVFLFPSFVQLGDVEAYRILSASGCTELEGVDDAAQFEGVRAACGTIGLDEDAQMQVRLPDRMPPATCGRHGEVRLGSCVHEVEVLTT